MSGANSTPLGRMNPAIGSGKRSSSLLNPSYMDSSSNKINDSDFLDRQDGENENNDDESNERKRKRRSRWQGAEKDKTFIPGMPTILPSNMTKDQEEAYLLQLQIEEFSRRLRSNDLGIAANPDERSPSPEPIYNNEGKRLNTREYRTRKKLEEDRHFAIQKMVKLNQEYKPPLDYKAPLIRVSDKVMIPQEEHPDINFVGLLIGPRGNTLKSMEKETGAKIIIRGKGSVKEGKVGRKDGCPLPGEDEPLHAYITGSNPDLVKKAVNKIKDIIKQGVEVPEGQNDLRRMQLRELALLNGTLRETDGPKCSNCGSSAHKSWQCQDKPNVTNSVTCSICGGTGHIAKDCRQRLPGAPIVGLGVNRQKIDEEYMSLMAELGEGPPPPNVTNGANMGGPNNQAQINHAPPIRSLFDTPVAPPKPLMGVPPPQTGKGMPMNNSAQGGNPNGINNVNIRNPPPNNWFGGLGCNPPRSNAPTNPPPPLLNSAPNFARPPPMNWQNSNQRPLMGAPPPNPGGSVNQNNQNNFPGCPPPNLLTAPPPPPPPTSNQNNARPQQPWINPGQGMNQWQGAGPRVGPPPCPVPPPRPVGPPQGWGWNGNQSMGPPPPPSTSSGPTNRGPGGVDLGTLLSAPPPPPPS